MSSSFPPYDPDRKYYNIPPKVVFMDLAFLAMLCFGLGSNSTGLQVFFFSWYLIACFVLGVVIAAPNKWAKDVPSWHYELLVKKFNTFSYNTYHWVTEILVLYLLYLNQFWFCIGAWVVFNAICSVYRKKPAEILEYRKNDPNFTEPSNPADAPKPTKEET